MNNNNSNNDENLSDPTPAERTCLREVSLIQFIIDGSRIANFVTLWVAFLDDDTAKNDKA